MTEFDPSAYVAHMRKQMDEVLKQTENYASSFQAQEFTGVGEVADGQVRVTLDSTSGAQEVWIDPRAMRKGSEELAELLKEAIQIASQDLSENMTGADGPMASMNKLMSEVSEQGEGSFSEGIKSMQNHLQKQFEKTATDLETRRRRISGDI